MDWPALLAQHRIEFVESGPNVSRNYIAVKCPFCGMGDPSQHMAISRTGEFWKCWRNPTHRGRDPARLLAALLRCSYGQALAILGPERGTPLPDQLLATVKAKLDPPLPEQPEDLALPNAFKDFYDVPSAARFVAYLRRRGFAEADIYRLTDHYGIRYCTRGPFHGRIIFPIYDNGKLLGWTGRTIYYGESLRYKTAGSVAGQLLWYDHLLRTPANTIILCEGPFDALKVAVLGRERGIVASCFFTSSLTEGQLGRLYKLLPRFRRRYLILDRDAVSATIRAAAQLKPLAVETRWLPKTIKDPGVLNKAELYALVDG